MDTRPRLAGNMPARIVHAWKHGSTATMAMPQAGCNGRERSGSHGPAGRSAPVALQSGKIHVSFPYHDASRIIASTYDPHAVIVCGLEVSMHMEPRRRPRTLNPSRYRPAHARAGRGAR